MDKQFDIFISFKATACGETTEDVDVADALYHALIQRGYRVFFSSQTVFKGGSSDFTREIDAALDTARLLIVVSSKMEYITSRWVEYEWKSFHADILSNVKNDAQIITFTDGLDTRDMPRILRYVQNFSYENREEMLTFIHNFFSREENDVFAESTLIPITGNKASIACGEHNLYNSAHSGEYEILRLRARRSYMLDMHAIEYAKSQMNRSRYNVLVLGCAYGFVAETRFGLDDDVENVICIDKNPQVLAKARALYCNYPHMKFYEVDLQSEDYVNMIHSLMEELGIDAFDIAYTSDLFRYLNNPQLTVRYTRKLLRKGGMMIIRDCDDSKKLAYPDQMGILDEVVNLSRRAPGMPNYCIGRELPQVIRNGGFEICDVRLDIYSTINLTYEEKEEFFVSTFGSRKNIAKQMLELENGRKEELEKLIYNIDRLEDIFFDTNFWYSESNLIFIARKP